MFKQAMVYDKEEMLDILTKGINLSYIELISLLKSYKKVYEIREAIDISSSTHNRYLKYDTDNRSIKVQLFLLLKLLEAQKDTKTKVIEKVDSTDLLSD